MRRQLHALVFLAIFAILCPRVLAAQTLLPCGAPSGATPEAMLSGLRGLVSGADATDSIFRANANLPRTAAANVTFITAESLCDVAARAMSALSSPPAELAPVWVIAVDSTRYVVFGVPRRENEYALSAVFDTSFTWLADF
jgi:hypothetical protein